MRYIRVEWSHANPHDPIDLYSELDDNRWEIRKVEIFPDGHYGYANSNSSSGDTYLGKEPIPDLSAIAADPQFKPAEISCDEFEKVWMQAHKKA